MFSGLIKKIMGTKDEPAVPAIHLAAFGKHPGWNDHIDDIGLKTDKLIFLKRLLYVEGIGHNIDAGVWDKLALEQKALEFNHLFVWSFQENILLGKFWASRDGVGRSVYPMIACADCTRLPAVWLAQNVVPKLEAIKQRCKATASAEEVKKVLIQTQDELDELAAGQNHHEEERILHEDALTVISKWPIWRENPQGLYRILYQLDREIGRFNIPEKSVIKKKTTEIQLSSKTFRIPLTGDDRLGQFLLWESFIAQEYGADIPALYIVPEQQTWVDIILRIPAAEQFYCLKANREAIPCISDIPYTLSEEFIERIQNRIQQPTHL